MATQIKLDSTDWTLNVLARGEESPLRNHGPFEIGADEENQEFWTTATHVNTYGLRSVKRSCLAYIKN